MKLHVTSFLQPPATSSLLFPDILITLFANTLKQNMFETKDFYLTSSAFYATCWGFVRWAVSENTYKYQFELNINYFILARYCPEWNKIHKFLLRLLMWNLVEILWNVQKTKNGRNDREYLNIKRLLFAFSEKEPQNIILETYSEKHNS